MNFRMLKKVGWIGAILMVLFYGYSSLQSPVSQPPSLEFGNYFKGSLNDAPQLSVDDLNQFSDIERSKFVSDGSCDAELRNSCC